MLHSELHAGALELFRHLVIDFHLPVNRGRILSKGIGEMRKAAGDLHMLQFPAEPDDFLFFAGEKSVSAKAGVKL